MKNTSRLLMRIAAFGTVLSLLFPFGIVAQVEGLDTAYDAPELRPIACMNSPYAGKLEPRIGGWVESEGDKLRLDIGTSIDLWQTIPSADDSHFSATIGTEFFTWTRLRSAGGFKFPVEAVDYYFGLFGHFLFSPVDGDRGLSTKVRLAHISAHLVDGDSAFFGSGGKPVTYSREFVELRAGLGSTATAGPFGGGRLEFHPYVGGVFLFNTIPDTLGRLTPYAGIDLRWQIRNHTPITLRAGYEARLNTELEPIGEHSLRAGIKIAELNGSGVVLEGSYYSGRSPYGQYFSRRENYFSFGFSVEH